MKVFRSFGSGKPYARDFTVRHGGTTVPAGALVIRGATPGTNGGMVIVGAAPYADAVGVLLEAAASATTDSNIDGSAEIRRKVAVSPSGTALVEYSQAAADDVAVTSSSGTTITVGSLEDNIDGGFILVVNSTNSNLQMRYLTASAAGSATMKTALGTALDSNDNIVKILPRLHQLADLVATADLLVTAAAAGTGRLCIVENFIKDVNIPLRPLDPITDSPRTISSRGKIFAEITMQNSAFFPFD